MEFHKNVTPVNCKGLLYYKGQKQDICNISKWDTMLCLCSVIISLTFNTNIKAVFIDDK